MKPILLEIPARFETERLVISIYENGDGEVVDLLVFGLLRDEHQ